MEHLRRKVAWRNEANVPLNTKTSWRWLVFCPDQLILILPRVEWLVLKIYWSYFHWPKCLNGDRLERQRRQWSERRPVKQPSRKFAGEKGTKNLWKGIKVFLCQNFLKLFVSEETLVLKTDFQWRQRRRQQRKRVQRARRGHRLHQQRQQGLRQRAAERDHRLQCQRAAQRDHRLRRVTSSAPPRTLLQKENHLASLGGWKNLDLKILSHILEISISEKAAGILGMPPKLLNN